MFVVGGVDGNAEFRVLVWSFKVPSLLSEHNSLGTVFVELCSYFAHCDQYMGEAFVSGHVAFIIIVITGSCSLGFLMPQHCPGLFWMVICLL